MAQNNIYYLTVSLGQEFGNSLFVWSVSGSLKRLLSRCQRGLQSPEGLAGLEDTLPRWHAHTVLVMGRRPQVLHMWPSPPAPWGPSWHGCWLPPEWSIQDSKAEARCLLWPSLRSHTLSFPQYPITYRGQPYPVLERLHRGVNTREARITGGSINIKWIRWKNY